MSRLIFLTALTLAIMLSYMAAPDRLLAGSYAQDNTDEDTTQETGSEDDVEFETTSTLPITPLNFSIIRKGRVRGTVSIVPILVIQEPTDAEIFELTELLPLIRSDLMAVASLLSQKRFRINRPIDPDFVARYFQHRLDQRLGKARLKVYIQDAIIRPIR